MQIAAGSKSLYHTAAAFAAGHVLAIEETAARLMMSTGMTRAEAVRALLQLTRQVLENFERLGPRAAWTGPLARGDYGVVAAHLAAMKRLPREFSNAYAVLNGLATLVLSPGSAGLLSAQNGDARNKISIVKALVKTRSAGGKG